MITNVREVAHAAAPGVRVGGIGAEIAVFVSAIYGSFPLMIALTLKPLPCCLRAPASLCCYGGTS